MGWNWNEKMGMTEAHQGVELKSIASWRSLLPHLLLFRVEKFSQVSGHQ